MTGKNGDSTLDLDPEAAEDEEIRLAMEMAMAAAKNPKLSADQLRALVAPKNKQVEIITEVEAKQQKKQAFKQKLVQKEKEKRWIEQKSSAYTWWSSTVNSVAKSAADTMFEAEKQYYAEEIKKDKKIIAIRRRMKACRKTLKAQRLSGNRIETKHVFKRQRMEKQLIQINDRLRKGQQLLLSSSFQVQEYAKAMMKASKKWRKKGSKQELSLEAQLCRNMHQMLAIEKQKSKVKKNSREVKKYMQRCKSWLSDKKAWCELHIMTLDSTASSMRVLYQETLSKQDALIARLSALPEFDGVELGAVQNARIELLNKAEARPIHMLNALRGLPMNDSVRNMKIAQGAKEAPATATMPGRKALYIEPNDDDGSVNSALSDPDAPAEQLPDNGDDEDESEGFDFGKDAPWNAKDSEHQEDDDKKGIDEQKVSATVGSPQEEEEEEENPKAAEPDEEEPVKEEDDENVEENGDSAEPVEEVAEPDDKEESGGDNEKEEDDEDEE